MKRFACALALLLGCSRGHVESTTTEKLAPPNAEAVKLFVSGAEQLKAGTPKALARAKEQLEQAVLKAPNLWEAHYDLGLVLRRLGQLDAARASLRSARELAPTAPEPILALSECELSRGDAGAAASLLEDLLAREPTHLQARLALSAVNRERGDLDGALRHAREVLVRNPSETRALVEVGRVYRAQKELDVAELVLEKARVLDDKNAAVYNELGLLALDRGDTQLAFTHFAHAGERNPRYAPAHMNRGSVLLKAGDFEAAERAYRAALGADA
jgi:Flp pilus assembly protein TadD